jgi:hypothetical protein
VTSAADRERYEAWLREHGLSTTPERPRRLAAREALEGIERVVERAEATRKHAPDRRSAERISDKLSWLDLEAARLREELGGGAYVNGQPFALTCQRCGNEIDRHSDYGTCPCTVSIPNPKGS